jgi:exodeoxyribonuclease VII small subunit
VADPITLPDVTSLSFEAALKELESIVTSLERGDVALEESITIYERGDALKKRCEALLSRAEERVEKIRTAEGKAVGVEPFDADP